MKNNASMRFVKLPEYKRSEFKAMRAFLKLQSGTDEVEFSF